MKKQTDMQGEGNKEAAKNYNDAQQKFVKSGRVAEAAENAEPKSKQEADELARAEATGRSRAKEEDPAVHRDGKKVGGGAEKKESIETDRSASK
jgi:hypothetical protein